MKKLPIAAAALLFGTSAYALAATKAPDMLTGATAVGTAAENSARLESAAVDWWGAAPAEADAATKANVAQAASDEFAAIDDDWDAIAAAKANGEDALEPEAEPVSAEATVLDEAPVPIENGVGGPDEGIDTAAAELTTRRAAENYPACRPGRGDDRCIQLYEPGVREQLASWSQPTGGFAAAGTADTQVAMGGPYEPVDSASETERLNQQALAASNANTQVAMGGPYEAVDEGSVETAAAHHEVAHETAMLGDGNVDTALGETAEDEEPAEV